MWETQDAQPFVHFYPSSTVPTSCTPVMAHTWSTISAHFARQGRAVYPAPSNENTIYQVARTGATCVRDDAQPADMAADRCRHEVGGVIYTETPSLADDLRIDSCTVAGYSVTNPNACVIAP